MLKKRYSSASKIDGVIDAEKVKSGPSNCIERDASQLFSLTYVTEDLQAMLRSLSRRFSPNGDGGDSPGLMLAEGVKGQGKSHDMILTYHLFASPELACPWMDAQGFPWSPPNDTVVLIEKFTDQYLPFDSLWDYVGQKLNISWSRDHSPSLGEFRSALADRHIVLIFDELERGITNISDPARRSQNLSFLQMISEEANRNNRVTLVAAIYNGAVEPGTTLKRIPRLELRFRKAEDRAAIVRHRLFSNAESYDRKSADNLIQSYLNTWRRMGVEVKEDYVARLRSSFPFLPELIELIFERMGGGEAFQGTRGALGLLGAMLDASGSDTRLLTAAHCKLTDSACADRLQDLDPAGTNIACASGNLRDLRNQPYAEAIASATLMASLVPMGRARGVSKEELIRHVAEPGYDPNQFEATLEAFRRYGSYFHKEEDRFYFDIEENEEAKVELEALRSGSDESARQQITRMGLGLPPISPSQLGGRTELGKQNIRAHWLRQPTDQIRIEKGEEALLLWSRFPDMRFMDTHAASAALFDSIWDTLQTAWMRTVQKVPSSRPVLVTSDHGYIFLGQGLSEPTLNGIDRPLEGKRFREFSTTEELPPRRPGLWVDPARRLAVLAGRVHNRPQAPSPSSSLYRHGGLSLMEMLTPWLVLGPKE